MTGAATARPTGAAWVPSKPAEWGRERAPSGPAFRRGLARVRGEGDGSSGQSADKSPGHVRTLHYPGPTLQPDVLQEPRQDTLSVDQDNSATGVPNMADRVEDDIKIKKPGDDVAALKHDRAGAGVGVQADTKTPRPLGSGKLGNPWRRMHVASLVSPASWAAVSGGGVPP